MSPNWIDPSYPFKIIQVKGITGNATGLLEYLCEADPAVPTTASLWRIRKFIYDSAGFNTHILWADGSRAFDKIQTSYSTYTYNVDSS